MFWHWNKYSWQIPFIFFIPIPCPETGILIQVVYERIVDIVVKSCYQCLLRRGVDADALLLLYRVGANEGSFRGYATPLRCSAVGIVCNAHAIRLLVGAKAAAIVALIIAIAAALVV